MNRLPGLPLSSAPPAAVTRYLPRRPAVAVLLLAGALGLGACTPTVQLAAPREPITINLNIKLDADVRLRIEEQAKTDVRTNPIF